LPHLRKMGSPSNGCLIRVIQNMNSFTDIPFSTMSASLIFFSVAVLMAQERICFPSPDFRVYYGDVSGGICVEQAGRDIVLYGTGVLARYVTKMIEKYDLFKIISYTADEGFISEHMFLGKPLVPFHEVDVLYPPEEFSMLVLIGYKNMRDRERMFLKAKEKGYFLPNCIAGNVTFFDDLELGENNIIYSGAYIGADAGLGNNNIIRPNVYLGHDVTVGDHCYISPGCNIGGGCILEDMSFIGLGSNITNGLKISRENLIGAGSLILKDTEPFGSYFGSPARKKGSHPEEGIRF